MSDCILGNAVEPAASSGPLGELLPALRRLDALLARAAQAAEVALGPQAAADRFRGLHLGIEDVAQLLTREPGAPPFDMPPEDVPDRGGSAGVSSRLAWLQRAYGLSSFDLDALVVALAPELDLRYERLYAFLQDDVTRHRPSVDLILNLLCPGAALKLAQRARFASDAPLLSNGVARLIPDPQQAEPPLLAHVLKVDEQVIRFLLDEDGLDSRLAYFSEWAAPQTPPADRSLEPGLRAALVAIADHVKRTQGPLRLHLRGGGRAGRRRVGEALAAHLGLGLLVADLPRALVRTGDSDALFDRLFREAWFRHGVLHLDGIEVVRGLDGGSAFSSFLARLAADGGVTVLGGDEPWVTEPALGGTLGVIAVDLDDESLQARCGSWGDSLAAEGIEAEEHDLSALSDRFRLTSDEIAEAARLASQRALWRAARAGDPPRVLTSDLFAAARALSSQDLSRLARRVTPRHGWKDIVLPDATSAQLHEIAQRVAGRPRVLKDWGFGHKLSLGLGVTALFSGPSGTGKTLAAEILAGELGLELYKIDLSGVVSKYIGETEKNLDRVFAAAENAGAVLFFDEADALFGKRSEVRDSHDRYANVEVSYLLQKMEEYEGIAVLATNLRANLDEAFVRRLAFIVHFPFPDEASRRLIWEGVWPSGAPVAPDVDPAALARDFKLSGGHIRNVALAAAFFASAERSPIGRQHVSRAVEREYQKLGKAVIGTPARATVAARS